MLPLFIKIISLNKNDDFQYFKPLSGLFNLYVNRNNHIEL